MSKKLITIFILVLGLICAGVYWALSSSPVVASVEPSPIGAATGSATSSGTATTQPAVVTPAAPSASPDPLPVVEPKPTPKPAPTPTPAPAPAPTPAPTGPKSYTMAEVALHKSQSDCWSVVDGGVYNLTSWIAEHPGGSGAILSMCGTDGSNAFRDQHSGERRPANELAGFKIGALAQ